MADGEPWRPSRGPTASSPPDSNISRECALNSAPIIEQASGFFGSTMMSLSALIVLMSALIGGVIYYQRSLARRQVEALRGILTDTMRNCRPRTSSLRSSSIATRISFGSSRSAAS